MLSHKNCKNQKEIAGAVPGILNVTVIIMIAVLKDNKVYVFLFAFICQL